MTPQERQLIAQLFDRLAALESSPRDPDAEAMIREGFRRAPNAAYALAQTVLLQDEALKAANARIQQYEQGGAGAPQQGEPPRGFLDSMRDSLFGRDEPRGSVPRVPQAGAPRPDARPDTRPDPWGQQPGYQQPGYAQPGYPPGAPAQGYAPSGGGSSFLGTAAVAAAGMIGGSLLMNGIRSAMGGHQAGAFSGAFDSINRGDHSPWGGSAGGSDLSRDAGLNDIGARRAGAFDQPQQARDDGEDTDADEMDDTDYASDDGFGGGDDNTA
ncbi:MAG: DUF2076 domain-containing protein [Alphaproteobacteria bacterium]|nr:DUF2076 domain-containing protein [Alphaproteobacteria bacterium]